MHRTFSKLGIAGGAFVVLVGLTVLITGKPAAGGRTGLPDDWTHHHLIFSNPGTLAQALVRGRFQHWYRTVNDPRYIMQQWKLNLGGTGSTAHPKPPTKNVPKPHRDWGFSLGLGTVAQNMYPAKYTWNINATPDCTNDFVVYGLNVAGTTGGQANMVALNNLYAGTSPAWICGTVPTVYWAYNVTTNTGGMVTTSPALSEDGNEVIFVESTTSNGSVLHVLRWNSSDGGTVASAKAPSQTQTEFDQCTGITSCLVSIALGTSSSNTTTNSSPFYDYTNDIVYVGDDSGTLYKVTPVLGIGTPNVTKLSVASGTKLTGPVYDNSSQNVFVGSGNGALYAVTASTMTVASTTPLQVGDSTDTCNAGTNGGDNSLIDPPIVDSTHGWVYEYATTAYDRTNTVVVQASTTLSSGAFTGTTFEVVGQGDFECLQSASPEAPYPTHAPEFDNTYYTGTVTDGHMWVCGRYTGAGEGGAVGSELWEVPTSGANGGLGTPAQEGADPHYTYSSNYAQCSPLTEIYNGETDYIFYGEGIDNPTTSPFSGFWGITVSGTTATWILNPPGYPSAVGGTSAIVVDNVSGEAQASSIYFTTLAPATTTTVCGVTSVYCAVKLTQSALE